MKRPEVQHTVSPVSSVGTPHPLPYPSQGGGVGRWVLGTALVLLFSILVGGVLFSIYRGGPLTAVPQATPQPLPHQPFDVQTFQPVPEGTDPWPEISVNGVLASPIKKKSSAILNGEMVFFNQKIQGVRLIEVSNDGVHLRYRGKTMALDIGSSTYDEED